MLIKLRTLICVALAGAMSSALAQQAKTCPPELAADEPVVPVSIEHDDIVAGALGFDQIRDFGRRLFVARFNRCDGAGRPASTGAGEKREVPTISEEGELLTDGQVAHLRTSGPDAAACVGCHSLPETGGAGDFAANVFGLAGALDPVTLSVGHSRSVERNAPGMHGAGPIEMLAREMSTELRLQAAGLADGAHTLVSKGVAFAVEIAGGEVVRADGIDRDLVVKPFTQAGTVVSLREFSTNAMNLHHGMQAEERFDLNPAKGFDPDFDEDGVTRELTIGDQTAISLWQAQLSTPTRVLPKGRVAREMVARGESVFDEVGCAACHKPAMVLESRMFVEPNPFNRPGTCAGAEEGCPPIAFDMTHTGERPRLEKGPGSTAVVRAYSDLKRHDLCDAPAPGAIRYFCNEQLAQGRPDQDGRPGAEFFMTRRLWDVGSSAPYGHRGDIGTITEAILYHGGEGRMSRDAFAARSVDDQKALVAFLKTLQVIPQSELED